MTYRRLTQETGTLNATPASGDQGGVLNVFNRSSSSVEVLYTDEFAVLGAQSVKIVTEATTETALLEVLAATAGVRAFTSAFLRIAAAPTAEVRTVSVRVNASTGSTDGVRIAILADRSVRLYNQAGGIVTTSAAGVIPAAAFIRADVWGNLSTGAVEVRVYNGLTTTGPLFTYSAASGWDWGTGSGATAITGLRAGKISTTGILTMWVDDMIVDDTATGLLAPPSDFVAATAPGPLTEAPTGTVNVPFAAIPGATSYRIYRALNVVNGGGTGIDAPGTYTQIASGVTSSPYADAGRPANTKLWYAYEGVN